MKQIYRILFLTLGGVFVLGQFGRFELNTGRAIYFQDIVLMLFVGVYLLDQRVNIGNLLNSSTVGKLIVGLNLWILMTSLFHFSRDRQQLLTIGLYLIRLDMIVLFATALADSVKRKILTRDELTSWLIGVSAAIASLGFVQYFLYPDTRGLALLGWDDHYYRMISTIFDPGFTGIILVLGGFIVLSAWLEKRSWYLTTCYFLLTTGLLLTYSRASYLAFSVGVVFLAWKLRKYSLLLLVPIFGLCMLLLPRPGGEGVRLERTASVVARVDSVSDSFDGFSMRDAVIGKGWYLKKTVHPTSKLGSISVPNHSSASENSYVFVFTSLGLVGLLICGGILYALLQSRALDTTVVLAFLAVGVHAFFTNTFFYSFVLILLAVITARSVREYPARSQSKLH